MMHPPDGSVQDALRVWRATVVLANARTYDPRCCFAKAIAAEYHGSIPQVGVLAFARTTMWKHPASALSDVVSMRSRSRGASRPRGLDACMGAPGPHDFAVRECVARPPHSAPRS